jgi:energy-coupling factor transporter ATP-binding protein EcfA2
VGKSSFIQFLKIHQGEFLSEFAPNFVDQFPLEPLNQISFNNLKLQLKDFRIFEEPLFKDFELVCADYIDKPIRDLSGGQKQIIKLLTSLYLGGDIYILDEPLQYLDKSNLKKVTQLLAKLKESGKTLLIVEHQANALKELIDHHIVVEKEESVRIYDRV